MVNRPEIRTKKAFYCNIKRTIVFFDRIFRLFWSIRSIRDILRVVELFDRVFLAAISLLQKRAIIVYLWCSYNLIQYYV